MRPAALLARAHALGVIVEVEGEALAVTSERTPPPDLLVQIRNHKAALVEHLQADLMPSGGGICPGCGRGRWLRAGPTSTSCSECEVDRLLHRATLAVGSPAALADDNEVMALGRDP